MAMLYDRNYNLQTYTSVLTKAREVFEKNNINTAQALNLFLKNVAVTGEINLLDEKELERQKWARELQVQVKQGIDEVEAGKGLSLEEVRKHFGL